MGVRAIFLVGYMACGKSSIGRRLAARLHWDFVDLDAHIEAREGKTIAEIFADQGESGFREVEGQALRDLTEALERDDLHRDDLQRDDLQDNLLRRNLLRRNTVVALGGGTFAHSTNQVLLRPWPSIFLDATADELWERSLAEAGKRPLRKDRAEFTSLYERRLPFYRQATVTVVTSGKDPASLCVEIERTLQVWEKLDPGEIAETIDAGRGVGTKMDSSLSQSNLDDSGTGETH
jgi:shikimate kinase